MNQERKKVIIKEILSLVLSFCLFYAIFFMISKFVLGPVQVTGPSMHPTLNDTHRGLTYLLDKEVNQFDIVILKGKSEVEEEWVKRVIALPNDTIYCKDDVIYINDEAINEDYLNQEYVESEREKHGYFTEDFDEVVLGDDEYFLMGDNRHYSMDSRRVGPFTQDEIIGHGVFIFYPFDHIGFN